MGWQELEHYIADNCDSTIGCISQHFSLAKGFGAFREPEEGKGTSKVCCCTFTGLPDVLSSRSFEYRDWEHKSIATDLLMPYNNILKIMR